MDAACRRRSASGGNYTTCRGAERLGHFEQEQLAHHDSRGFAERPVPSWPATGGSCRLVAVEDLGLAGFQVRTSFKNCRNSQVAPFPRTSAQPCLVTFLTRR